MSQRKCLVGNKYGHLTVREMLYGYQGRKHTFVRCECDCGNEKIIDVNHLNRGKPSCGCMTTYYRSLHNRSNEIGQTYGYLTIIDIDYSKRPSQAICQCKCGNIIKVTKADVVIGHTQSCGCLQAQRASESNTKDFTNMISDLGVVLKEPSHQVRGVWRWKCICPKCGKEFIALPANVLTNKISSCGCLKQSSMEFYIEQLLQKYNMNYQTEVRFNDCRNHNTLPFDFAVYNSNNDLLCLIEYDGKQHFEPIDYFGGDKAFEIRQQCDEIKTNYCKDKGIKLIRLNYNHSLSDIDNVIKNIQNP